MTNDPQPTALACIALGANLGDREGAIHAALDALRLAPGVAVRAVSSLHETEAVTLPGAPEQPAYLNGAVVVETTLDPDALLGLLLEIERALGRARADAGRWAARTIDLDLLLYGDRVIDRPGLRVPHPRMHERRFVLAPLAEIAPDWMHPERRRPVRELLAALEPSARRGRHLVAAIACALGLVAGAAPAQEEAPAPSPAAPDLQSPPADAERSTPATAAEALARMQAAYLGERIGEHIELVARSSGQVRQERLTLRLGSARVRIDFDGMVAEASPEGLAIAHAQSGRARLTPALAGADRFALLRRAMPPLPLPQLSVAADGSGATGIEPLCRDLRWFSVTPMDGLLLVEGVGPECSASLALDDSTWRLRSATLRGRTERGPISVELRVEGFDPGDPEEWGLDRAGLVAVESLAELAPREGDVRVGDPSPDLLLLTRDATPWRLGEAIDEASSGLALLLFREDAPGVRAAAEALREAKGSEAPSLRVVVGVVLPASGVEPLDRLAALAERWGDDLLWTVSAETTLGRFAPDSLGVLVIVDDAGVVRLVEPIENRAGDARSLARRIVESLQSD